MTNPVLRLPPLALAAAGGLALGAGLGALGLARRDRPLHSFGESHSASILVDAPAATGVPLLDEPGTHRATVRFSRAVSLAHRGPDAMGLGLVIEGAGPEGRDAHLLLSTTGLGPITRHVLLPHLRLRAGTPTSLLPRPAPTGALLLGAIPESKRRWSLVWTRPGRRGWERFGWLRLGEATADPGRLDPVHHHLRGLPPSRWESLLRDPAYRVARHIPVA